ncbi:MAG: ribonuclease domain-containing protein [Floccifex sp.]
MKKIISFILSLFLLTSCSVSTIDEEGSYTSKEDVSFYIHTYQHLPDNYITKQEAMDSGWDASLGNLWDVCPGMSIGGDVYKNYEKSLPEDTYHECDIDFEGGYRNGKRLVYGQSGSIYYTQDHYETFEQLY